MLQLLGYYPMNTNRHDKSISNRLLIILASISLAISGCAIQPHAPTQTAEEQRQQALVKPEVMQSFYVLKRLMERTPLARNVKYNTEPLWKYISWTNPSNPNAEHSFDLPSILPDTIAVSFSPGSAATAPGWKLSHTSFIKNHYYFFLTSTWSQAEAEEAAQALRILANDARQCYHEESDKFLEKFKLKAQDWQALEVRPIMPEEARKHRILAENAFREKDLEKASDEYDAALKIYPCWPSGLFNLAYIDAANENYQLAVFDMQRYLTLVPNAKDAQHCRDDMLIWKGKMGE